jgi:hypothetical protein
MRSPSYGPHPKPSSNPKSRKYFRILARLDICFECCELLT